jgi:hypothetical protein
VTLLSQPSSNVTVTFIPTIFDQVTFTPAQLQFNPSNWDTPQIVRISAVDDGVEEQAITVIEVNVKSSITIQSMTQAQVTAHTIQAQVMDHMIQDLEMDHTIQAQVMDHMIQDLEMDHTIQAQVMDHMIQDLEMVRTIQAQIPMK